VRIAYFDIVGGASGDMLLGALADLGVGAAIRAATDTLNLPGCEVRFDRVMKGALSAMQATVTTPKKEQHRHLGELLSLLHSADLPSDVKSKTETILTRLAEVEARIHNEPVDHVHLHELGGDDTLIDIVGVLAGLVDLKVDSVIVSPLPLARGFTKSAHGQLPLPAPATLALLTDVPIRYVDIDAELVTPTGAALLTAIADRFGGFPEMTLKRVSCGAGRRDLPFPNVIRLWLGEIPSSEGLIIENLTLIETNIDDMNPQIYTHVMERLFAQGALDVTLTPQQMKKNRPAILLSVLCRPDLAETVTRTVFEETTTLGVRRQAVERVCLPRVFEIVQTPYGPIHIKVARWNSIERCMPEYEDCRQAAEAHHVPLAEVMDATRKAMPVDL
jgi:uncharacterized protein (TIGR00299 family) protein